MDYIKRLLRQPDSLAICILLIFNLLIFRPVFTSGLLPIPADLLVSFFFPWYSGGWEGYDPWTRHKEFIASDTIRQSIPWRLLAIEQLKKGQPPLWNPYNFSGTPLAANMQTAAFYPLNFFFFILPFLPAWVIYIMLQPFLMSLFTYLYCCSLKLNRWAGVLAGIAVSSSSFFVTWLELGFVGHTILWLPLMLLAIEKWFENRRLRYFYLLIFASVCSLLSGHLQTAFHVFSVVGIYWLWKILTHHQVRDLKHTSIPGLAMKQPSKSRDLRNPNPDLRHQVQDLTRPPYSKVRDLIVLILWPLLTLGLTAFQLIPAMELRSLSPMVEPFVKDVFVDLKTPWKNIITILAPDFFGNPATLNFWSKVYGDGTPFFGVIPAILAIYGLVTKRNKQTIFWAILALVYLLYGFPGPLF